MDSAESGKYTMRNKRPRVQMGFFVRVDLPDYLLKCLSEDIRYATYTHARAEVALNGGKVTKVRSYTVTPLSNEPSGRTNFSQVFLNVEIEMPHFREWQQIKYVERR